jgi:hypothetical protein
MLTNNRSIDATLVGKKTEDGLPIYDTSELKIGLGGGELVFFRRLAAPSAC